MTTITLSRRPLPHIAFKKAHEAHTSATFNDCFISTCNFVRGTGGDDYGLASSGTRGCEIETREKAMKSDPLPREKTGGGQVFRALGGWVLLVPRVALRYSLATCTRPPLSQTYPRPSLPRPPSSFPPSFSLSLWYDIIVELIVTLLKHHSYLFLSLSLLLSSSLSPLSL